MPIDVKDINLRWPGHPKYIVNKPIEDDVVEVLVQKLEMVLFTRNQEVYGDQNFGANLEYYLWSTSLSNQNLKDEITDQINTYIPELNTVGYTLNLQLYTGIVRDIMVLNFTILGYNIGFVFD